MNVLWDIWTKDIEAMIAQPGKDPRRKLGISKLRNPECCAWMGKTDRKVPVIRVADRVYYVADLLLEARERRPFSEGMGARHSCEDHACVNINHLYEGPRLEIPRAGFDDRVSHYGYSKLTANMVRTIRASPSSNAEVAATLGVSIVTIWKVRNHKTWKHVT